MEVKPHPKKTVDPYHGFGSSEIFTLIIGRGQEEKPLMVQRDILVQIPYFESALRSGNFPESQEKVFKLPEDDARAVADVIHFVYTGRVPALSYSLTESGSVLPEYEKRAEHYVKAYVVADKFMSEATANALVDAIVSYMAKLLVPPSFIVILKQAGLCQTPLYTFFLEEAAYTVKDGARNQDNIQWFGSKLDKDGLIELMKAVARVNVNDKRPAIQILNQPCWLHKHELTKQCVRTAQRLRRV